MIFPTATTGVDTQEFDLIETNGTSFPLPSLALPSGIEEYRS